MEINGKIIELLPEKSGQSARGSWRKQEYVLETEDQYPKKICFMAWGDKIDEFAIQEGEELIISIDIESREYNNRWYTDVRAWRMVKADQPEPTPMDPGPIPEPEADFNNNPTDDLPF